MTFGRQTALASYKAASDLIGKAAFFFVLVVAARKLSTDAFGLFSLASTLGWMLSVGTDFGLQMYMAREIARAPGAIATILPPILRIRLALTAVAAFLTVVAAAFFLPPNQAVAFSGIAFAYLVSAFVEFLNYVYRAVARSELESTLNLAQRLVTLALALVTLEISPSLTAMALALLVPPGVMAFISIRVVHSLAAKADAGTAPPFVFSRTTFLTDVFPLGLGILLSSLYFRIDLFLLEYWRGLAEVASYNAVFRLVDALRLFPAAILAVLLPIIFGRPTGGFVLRMSAGLAILGVLITAAVYPLVPQLIELAYGPTFLTGVRPLRVLLLAFPLLALNYGLTHAVIGWGGQRTFALGCAAALAANIGMNTALIPRFGATGAAWSTLLTEVVLTAIWLIVLSQRRGRSPAPGAQLPAN